MTDLDVRLLRAEERDAAAVLFEKAFGHARSDAEWRWRYDDDPHGAAFLMGAFASSGDLVGFVGGYPVILVEATSGETREIPVIHVGDAMVDPDWDVRLSAGGSPWLQTMRALFRTVADHGYGAAYGVMTRRLARIYNRYVGTRTLTDVVSWRASVDALRLPDRRPGSTVTRLRRPQQIGPEFDALFRAAAPAHGLLVRRDADYVRWRHLARPDRRTRLWTAREEGRLVGWAAFRHENRRLVWGDLLVAPGYEEAAGRLLAAELGSFRWFRSPLEVTGWFPTSQAWPGERLDRLGLEPGPTEDDLTSVVWGCSDPSEPPAAGLYYTRADCDLF